MKRFRNEILKDLEGNFVAAIIEIDDPSGPNVKYEPWMDEKDDESKPQEIEKCTLGMFNPTSMKDRYLTEKLDEIIDAVNELRREREGK